MIPKIRQARPDECSALTDLTMRSKAHWGYDSAFMADVREDLEIVAERFLPDFHVYIIETDNELIGFSSLCAVDAETVELTHLFVEPKNIGKGFGKRLWRHSLGVAQSLGFQRLTLSSDPYAEPFYASQGAVRIGEKESTVRAGRMLPLMEYVFDSTPGRQNKGVTKEMTTKKLIRFARPDDLDALSLLFAALWPEESAEEHSKELTPLLSGKLPSVMPVLIWVAEAAGGEVVGFIEAGLRSCADGCDMSRPVGYVEGWYVAENYRRTGIGSALLRAAEDWAREQGCTEMASDALVENVLSQDVHLAAGFTEVDRAVKYRKGL